MDYLLDYESSPNYNTIVEEGVRNINFVYEIPVWRLLFVLWNPRHILTLTKWFCVKVVYTRIVFFLESSLT